MSKCTRSCWHSRWRRCSRPHGASSCGLRTLSVPFRRLSTELVVILNQKIGRGRLYAVCLGASSCSQTSAAECRSRSSKPPSRRRLTEDDHQMNSKDASNSQGVVIPSAGTTIPGSPVARQRNPGLRPRGLRFTDRSRGPAALRRRDPWPGSKRPSAYGPCICAICLGPRGRR